MQFKAVNARRAIVIVVLAHLANACMAISKTDFVVLKHGVGVVYGKISSMTGAMVRLQECHSLGSFPDTKLAYRSGSKCTVMMEHVDAIFFDRTISEMRKLLKRAYPSRTPTEKNPSNSTGLKEAAYQDENVAIRVADVRKSTAASGGFYVSLEVSCLAKERYVWLSTGQVGSNEITGESYLVPQRRRDSFSEVIRMKDSFGNSIPCKYPLYITGSKISGKNLIYGAKTTVEVKPEIGILPNADFVEIDIASKALGNNKDCIIRIDRELFE